MNLLKVAVLSFSSFIILFILVKLIGNREMSQLSMFDYIVSITIGSIAAEMATALESSFWEPTLAMVIYGLSSLGVALSTAKSLKIRRIISGKSLTLLDNGKLYRKNFKKAKIDISEFLMQCRYNGYFNVNDLQTAILEANGKISFIPKSLKRPLTPEDLNIEPVQETVVINVILDGYVLKENLKKTGNNMTWLNNEIKKQGTSKISDIFLATCDTNNNLSIYVKLNTGNSHDYFQ